MLFSFFTLFLGLVFLYFGAEWLVTSSVFLAKSWKIPSSVIGILLIGFGSSTPELIVTLEANLTKEPIFAMANIVGSNLFNTAFILGLCLCIKKASFSKKTQRVDLPFMGLACLLLGSLYFFPSLGRIGGFFFLLLLGIYIFFQIYSGKNLFSYETKLSLEKPSRSSLFSFGMFLLGLLLLLCGSHFFLEGVIFLSEYFYLPKSLVGFTLVAIGTSIPELATCLVAAFRGHPSIYLGNILGSNIYNVLGILGIAALCKPIVFEGLSVFGFLFMSCTNILLVLLAFFSPLGKKTGVFFLLSYFAFLLSMKF